MRNLQKKRAAAPGGAQSSIPSTSVVGSSPSRLVLILDSGKAEHYVCPCRECKGDHLTKAWSYLHAQSQDWCFTKDRQYSPKGEAVAVCPSCMKRILKDYR